MISPDATPAAIKTGSTSNMFRRLTEAKIKDKRSCGVVSNATASGILGIDASFQISK